VELNGRQVHFQQAHVLDDERIGAGFIQLPGQQAAAVELVIVQDGIERDKDLGAVAVGKIAQAFDIGDIVAGAITGAKGRATDVDGIGAVLDGFNAEIGVLAGARSSRGC
jgi:hypothetical protein